MKPTTFSKMALYATLLLAPTQPTLTVDLGGAALATAGVAGLSGEIIAMYHSNNTYREAMRCTLSTSMATLAACASVTTVKTLVHVGATGTLAQFKPFSENVMNTIGFLGGSAGFLSSTILSRNVMGKEEAFNNEKEKSTQRQKYYTKNGTNTALKSVSKKEPREGLNLLFAKADLEQAEKLRFLGNTVPLVANTAIVVGFTAVKELLVKK